MKAVTNVEISHQTLYLYLLFNKPIKYDENITLYPVRMKDVLTFQQCQIALTLRKDSIFHEKNIIKMGYLDFIKYAYRNNELAENYKMPFLPMYYDLILSLLQIVCGEDTKISYNSNNLDFFINDKLITNEIFDNLRKIIMIQNDIDFDIDEFMNIDTVKALEKAKEFEAKKNKEKSDIEDYIDSLIIDLKVTEEYVANLTIRKFWRYIKRINKHEEYQACRSGQMSGMVTFKEPIQHWMTSIELTDKYENLKTDEGDLRSKIN